VKIKTSNSVLTNICEKEPPSPDAIINDLLTTLSAGANHDKHLSEL